MAREIDARKRRKALARLRRARAAAEQAIERSEDPEAAEAARRALSAWEAEFLDSLEARLGEYGSAFADPQKGALDEPLSRLQVMKLKEIEKKAKGASARPGRRGPMTSRFRERRGRPSARSANIRDVNADLEDDPMHDAEPAPPESGFRPRLIKGGKKD